MRQMPARQRMPCEYCEIAKHNDRFESVVFIAYRDPSFILAWIELSGTVRRLGLDLLVLSNRFYI